MANGILGGTPAQLAAAGSMDEGWADALAPVADDLATIDHWLAAQTAAGVRWLPAPELVLRAFRTPFSAVRVLIVGQDPYPTPGHPIGLSFAADREVRPVPRSLANIHRELRGDLGVPTPEHGDLSSWTGQGVLLLNRVLTVEAGSAGSHRRHGWEAVTEQAIRALAARPAPLVSILWGKDAERLAPLLESSGDPDRHVIVSAHPSPLSASRGFFGSKPFSRTNDFLVSRGVDPIDWSLD
ncbi:uracil-DNA glycosylase [Plantibacter cousiniae (nom. nud.)]|uniref:Uracil-DNA glycosylase n=1 Tax=Plantibacter cousiniae (nom. nud.) TaxID=199709 RepID=A0ABY1LQL5_9MICO|nr:uracil-DNA glycosylase [Plantibacter cousiniae]SKC73827.1 Uracil-DNA glycosylase [Plantibacter cousiniae]